MASDVFDMLMSMEDSGAMVEARAQKLGRPNIHKKRTAKVEISN
jgi:hypothetical protein